MHVLEHAAPVPDERAEVVEGRGPDRDAGHLARAMTTPPHQTGHPIGLLSPARTQAA
jgi:hypothetical protein